MLLIKKKDTTLRTTDMATLKPHQWRLWLVCTVLVLQSHGGTISDNKEWASPHKRKPGFGPWRFYKNEQGTHWSVARETTFKRWVRPVPRAVCSSSHRTTEDAGPAWMNSYKKQNVHSRSCRLRPERDK